MTKLEMTLAHTGIKSEEAYVVVINTYTGELPNLVEEGNYLQVRYEEGPPSRPLPITRDECFRLARSFLNAAMESDHWPDSE